MINGISIRVLAPFKFYAADRTLDNGVNFQNVDNTELYSQDWEGVFPNRFIQPVPRFWNDYSPGIDFQFMVDGAQTLGDTTVTIDDLDGNTVDTLTLDSFYTISPEIVIRAYMDEMRMDDGCYIIVIRIQGNPVFNSEIISIADTHDDCYPLEYSNFENDFGLIFTNATAETWKGKILIPLRMYVPVPEDEKEVYNNDVGSLTTLRTISKRIYEIQSFPVATWFTEKIKLIFGLSVLTLNKLSVNTEDGIEPSIIPESDKMEFTGNVQMNDFTEDYTQDEAINLVTELLTSWQDDGATVGDWTDFDTNGNGITLGDYSLAGIAEAFSNDILLSNGQVYLIYLTITGTVTDMIISIDGQTFDIVEGKNMILFTSTTSGTDHFIMNTKVCNFSALTSMKRIT